MKSVEIIKNSLTVEDILKKYGYPVGSHGRTSCPLHGGQNKTSFSYNEKGYFCFSCQAHGDVINLVSEIFGIGFRYAVNLIDKDFSLHLKRDPVPYPRDGKQQEEAHREKVAQGEKKAEAEAAYRAIARSHAILMRNGCDPETLENIAAWLDENINIMGK